MMHHYPGHTSLLISGAGLANCQGSCSDTCSDGTLASAGSLGSAPLAPPPPSVPLTPAAKKQSVSVFSGLMDSMDKEWSEDKAREVGGRLSKSEEILKMTSPQKCAPTMRNICLPWWHAPACRPE